MIYFKNIIFFPYIVDNLSTNPTLYRSQVLWLPTIFVFYSIWFPLWGVGILELDCFLSQNPFYFFLSRLYYPLTLYTFYSFYIVLYHWEDNKMNTLFNRTVTAICFGMLIWFLLTANAAF